MTKRYLAYMMAPVSPSNGRTTAHNIAVAKDWYRFLRELTADMPITITCPWLVGILLGDQDGDPAQRERGLVDSETGAAHCDLTIAVGQTVTLTTGMAREDAACPGPCVDLLDLGMEYETPQRMGRDRREEVRERLRLALQSIAIGARIEPAPVAILERRDVEAIARLPGATQAAINGIHRVVEPGLGGPLERLIRWAPSLLENGRQVLTDHETQRSISDWANATFGAASSNARVASRSNQEMAELLRWLTCNDNSPEARLETADVVIVLYRLAERMGFDLQQAIDEKMKINRSREWVMTGDGHGQHVRKDKQQ